MADTKISNLNALAAAPSSGDFFALVDTSASETKKIDAKYLARASDGQGPNVTGGGTLALAGFTLTVPATGTVALLATANVFTAAQEIVDPTAGITTSLTVHKASTTAGSAALALYHNSSGFDKFLLKSQGDFDGTPIEALNILASGRVLIGTATDSGGKLQVVQSSTTAAIPALRLNQADTSDEFIEFVSTVGAGLAIDTAAIGTYYGKVRVSVAGVGNKFIALYNT